MIVHGEGPCKNGVYQADPNSSFLSWLFRSLPGTLPRALGPGVAWRWPRLASLASRGSGQGLRASGHGQLLVLIAIKTRVKVRDPKQK